MNWAASLFSTTSIKAAETFLFWILNLSHDFMFSLYVSKFIKGFSSCEELWIVIKPVIQHVILYVLWLSIVHHFLVSCMLHFTKIFAERHLRRVDVETGSMTANAHKTEWYHVGPWKGFLWISKMYLFMNNVKSHYIRNGIGGEEAFIRLLSSSAICHGVVQT